MQRSISVVVFVGLLLVSVGARAQESAAPTAGAKPADSPHKLVSDYGLNVNTFGPSMAAFTGFQYDPVRIGALLDLGVTWYDWVEFYGVGVGPVLELPGQFRSSLVAGVGWQRYHFDSCNDACKAARVDESRLAYEGRLGFGRGFRVGRHDTSIVVMGWFTANYSSKRQAEVTASDASNEPASSGGFRPGALLSVGFDMPL